MSILKENVYIAKKNNYMSALLGALASSAMGIFGNQMQNQQNINLANQQQQWSERMQHAQQKFDLSMWNKTNEYNSPQSQMARFAQAGLNPHLIYGKGSSGNAMPLRSPDIKPYSRAQANNVMAGVDVFGKYTQFKNIQANTDVAEEQAKNIQAQTTLSKLNAIEKFITNKRLRSEMPYFSDIAQMKFLQLTNEYLKSGEQLKKSNYEAQNEAMKAEFNRATMQTRIKQAINTNNAIALQNVIKEYQANLAKAGIDPNSPQWARLLVTWLTKTGAMDWMMEKGVSIGTKFIK